MVSAPELQRPGLERVGLESQQLTGAMSSVSFWALSPFLLVACGYGNACFECNKNGMGENCNKSKSSNFSVSDAKIRLLNCRSYAFVMWTRDFF